MYLTRAYLNPRRKGAIKLISNPRALHALLAGCHPDQPPVPPGEPAPRTLWRLDTDDPRKPVLFLVSPTRPDLTQLIEDAGWPAAETPQWATKPYTPFLNRLTEGQTYTFRLTANPTHALTPTGPGQRGKRVPHTTPHHQLTWLTQRAPHHGFTIPPTRHQTHHGPDGKPPLQLHLTKRATDSFRKTDHAGKPIRVTLTTATYEGTLTITNPHALRTLLTTGIGTARAYGCGLLTLAPQPTPA
ncbi:type I-E CRISPR-associated protein Cas6/Cse3/CasE [Streptomyces sp. NPDC050523]|uniref:type I-E CRISPR-associated protein Cas6/Cse3/CasE n=1 Tax=Streptomyces sp. NPDC050523 TaxID=3365622 RepID=UPI0037B192A1